MQANIEKFENEIEAEKELIKNLILNDQDFDNLANKDNWNDFYKQLLNTIPPKEKKGWKFWK